MQRHAPGSALPDAERLLGVGRVARVQAERVEAFELRRVRPATALPTRTYGLEQAGEAYKLLDEGKAGAAVVLFGYSGREANGVDVARARM